MPAACERNRKTAALGNLVFGNLVYSQAPVRTGSATHTLILTWYTPALNSLSRPKLIPHERAIL